MESILETKAFDHSGVLGGPAGGTLSLTFDFGVPGPEERPRAAAEFQKFLDHAGIVQNFLLGSLARLQLGRAYVVFGDTVKAKSA